METPVRWQRDLKRRNALEMVAWFFIENNFTASIPSVWRISRTEFRRSFLFM